MKGDAFFRLPEEKQQRIYQAGVKEFARCSYSEAGTDPITLQCGISKGLLFHYFGSKAEFYLFCLEEALKCLTNGKGETGSDPALSYRRDRRECYAILFSDLEGRIQLCRDFPDEMRFVSTAFREKHSAVSAEKERLFSHYVRIGEERTASVCRKAMMQLSLRNPANRQAAEGFQLYVTAIRDQYVSRYQDVPDRFFGDAGTVRQEWQGYLDLMLDGLCR